MTTSKINDNYTIKVEINPINALELVPSMNSDQKGFH